MRAIVAGGTGFIGRELCLALRRAGWEVMVLSRSPEKVARVFGAGVFGVRWTSAEWAPLINGQTVVVNLSGENIAAGRWTQRRKGLILESRVQAGLKLMEGIDRAETPPAAFIQGSAIGHYGARDEKPVEENGVSGDGFLAEVTRKWEASTAPLDKAGIRRAVIRTGVVLGHGGALAKMLPPFRFFVGGPVGSGRQGMSWIHLTDQVEAIRFLIENPDASGVYNLTAPNPVSSREFAKVLGSVLRRPALLPVPGFALRLLLGAMADELLLSGQFVRPARLLEAGYVFRFPNLREALENILKS